MSEPPDYRRGLEDHHDPTAGLGGAPPARSALTLRLALATFGLVVCLVGAVVAGFVGVWWFAALMGTVAAVSLIDLIVVGRRKARGEPG